MTPSHASDISDPSHKFEDSNGKPLASIRTHTDMTNSRCVLWDEVTDTFANISYLQDSAAQRVFFEVDKEYNLYVLNVYRTYLRIWYNCCSFLTKLVYLLC